jgi:hypothetical protein
MTTPRFTSLVALATALTMSLSVGACAGTPAQLAPEPAAASYDAPLVRFDNDAREHVHVYLVGAQREWLLARVAPGARAILRIPEAALAEDQGSMRLAVLAGDRMTLRAAGDARAAITIQQPAASLAAQRWTFSQTLAKGQLTALGIGRRQ